MDYLLLHGCVVPHYLSELRILELPTRMKVILLSLICCSVNCNLWFIRFFAIKAVFVLVSNYFRKCFSVNAGVWLCMENKFFGKYFQLTVCFSWFDSKIGFSQNFHFKPFSDSRAKREREREREEEERAQITPWTQSPDHAFDFTDLRTDLWTHEPIFDPEPSTHEPSTLPVTQKLRATNSLTNLSLCVILIDPRTDRHFCVILIFYSLFDLWFFLLLLWWWCFGGFPVVWWWWKTAFFRMLPNTWKYFLEQFS